MNLKKIKAGMLVKNYKEIYMPRTWSVEKKLRVSMGDYKEKGVQQLTEGGPVIYLTGSVSMGDVTVVFM